MLKIIAALDTYSRERMTMSSILLSPEGHVILQANAASRGDMNTPATRPCGQRDTSAEGSVKCHHPLRRPAPDMDGNVQSKPTRQEITDLMRAGADSRHTGGLSSREDMLDDLVNTLAGR
jgi:hypothetical protein